MGKYCPNLGRKVVYLDCAECDVQVCKGEFIPDEKHFCKNCNRYKNDKCMVLNQNFSLTEEVLCVDYKIKS